MSKQLSKEERRAQLLEAALVAFGRRGYHETQVSDIIAEAEVARGTFYLHFEGKREIFEEIIAMITQIIQAEIKPINKSDIAKLPLEIVGNIERVIRALLKNPNYLKIFFSDAVGIDAEFDARRSSVYKEILGHIENGLSNGQAMGVIRAGDIHVMSVFLLGALKESFYQVILGNQAMNFDTIVKDVYRFVLHAVVKPELLPRLLKASDL